MLNIENLSVKIKDKEIIKNLNLKIGAGEVHAIMGPNGSGKSTLSKVLAGYPGYTVEGKIEYVHNLKSYNLLELDPEERSLMGLFLSFQYPVEVPGLSNLTFLKAILNAHLKKSGAEPMDAFDFQEHVTKYLEVLGVDKSFLDRALNEGFSGGEKKRNEMLQMLLLQPKLAILDETDSGLDVDSLKVVSDTINSLREKTSFILVTHYNRILDHVVPDFVHIFKDGNIVKSGTKELALEVEKRGYGWI